MRLTNSLHISQTVSAFSLHQLQVDGMASSFSTSLSHPVHILPMSVASLSSQLFRLASLSLGAGRWISQAIALLGEAAVFRASSWAVAESNSPDNLWDARSYGQTVLDLGIFKLLHGILPAQNVMLRNGVQAAGMLVAEEVATSISWAEKSRESLGSRFTQAFATSFEMEVGLGLAGIASGHRLEVMRRSVEGAAAVFSAGERFRTSSRTFSEREILSMHSPYREIKLKEIPSPSALHARLSALDELETRACHEGDLIKLWRIFTEVKEKVLRPEGKTKSERELLRYAATRVLLRVADTWTRLGGDKAKLQASTLDPEFSKSSAQEYLYFERAANPLENSGATSQPLRDYLNARLWNETGAIEQDFSIIQSPKENILFRLLELNRLSESRITLSVPELWRQLVQLRDIALEPRGGSLEERECIRYMAVRSMLKLSNELRQKAAPKILNFRDVEALLSNLALRNRTVSDYLHYEIESNSQNLEMKEKVLKFKGWEKHERAFDVGYFMAFSALTVATVARFSVIVWQQNAHKMLAARLAEGGFAVVLFSLAGLTGSLFLTYIFSQVSIRLLDSAADVRYRRRSYSHQSVRDFLDSEPWREIEASAPRGPRVAPLEAATTGDEIERNERVRLEEGKRGGQV